MAKARPFVGRKAELEQFKQILEDPTGQAVLVVGQAGMGKTWLIDRMARIAQNHPRFKCGCVRYELTSSDSPDIVMERMMDDAFRAGEVVEGSFDSTARRRKQWYALLTTMIPKGKDIAELLQSLERNPKRPTREEFLDRLRLISAKMGDAGRAVFVLDPLEYLSVDKDEYAEEWAVVVRALPEKIKLVFAQRPADVLARYPKFARNEHVVRIPPDVLGRLDEDAVDELLRLRAAEIRYRSDRWRKSMTRYGGHPYALQGAMDLLAAGTMVEELPEDPTETGVVEEQWKKICKAGPTAIRLFKAYAVLEVLVPEEIVQGVAQVDGDTRLGLLAGSVLLERLLHDEGRSSRVYHRLLAQYILSQMGDAEKKEYHVRAVDVYRQRWTGSQRRDRLAATRYLAHVLGGQGMTEFVRAFLNEWAGELKRIGLLDAGLSFAERALEMISGDQLKKDRVLLKKAEFLAAKGGRENAVDVARSTAAFQEMTQKDVYADCLTVIGDCYHMADEYEKAEIHLWPAVRMWELLGDREGLFRATERLAQILELSLKFHEATDLLDKTEKEAEEAGGLGLRPMFWYRRGSVARILRDLVRAKGCYEQCQREAIEKLDKVWEAHSLRGLGEVALLELRLEPAKEFFDKAAMHFKECDEHRGQIWIMRFQAELERQRGLSADGEEATKLLSLAEEEYRAYIHDAERISNPNGVAWGYIALAFLLMEAEHSNRDYKSRDQGSARDYLQRAIEFKRFSLNEGHSLVPVAATIGRGIGVACGLWKDEGVVGDIEKAIRLAEKADLKHEAEILGILLSVKPKSELPSQLAEELKRPRNPT